MSRQQFRHPDRHPQPTSPGVLIGYCHPGHVSSQFHDSLMGVMLWDHAHSGHVLSAGGYASLTSGPRIASGRTQIVDAFLNHPSKPEWLWMLDTDMAFPADTLDRLIDRATTGNLSILGGLCFGGGRDNKLFPTLYVLEASNGQMARMEDYPRDALCKVDATGAACLLIRRRVFEAMQQKYPRPYPWFQETVIGDREYGEDITFCLRAGRLGIETYVDTSIKLGHQKTHLITEEVYDAHLAATDLPVAA